QLHAGTNDEVIVSKRVAGFEHDAVLIRVKCFDGSVDQSHTSGDKATFGPLGLGHVIGACADQSEGRLVIVCLRRLNDRDVQRPWSAAAQTCRDRDAGGAPANNQDLMMMLSVS